MQAYAYEAATGAADLLDALGVGEAGTRPAELRRWAADLRARFRRTYWVETVEGRYPAIALDRHKRPVDSLTSNIGHLIGTGLLDPAEETGLAALLLGPSLSSGYGIRTLSKGASGYWPLSYHGGSVWTHDTAIAIFGLSRAGLHQPARRLAEQLLVAAEAFGWRVPELHGGDADDEVPRPTPYPAACRPQAWGGGGCRDRDGSARPAPVRRPTASGARVSVREATPGPASVCWPASSSPRRRARGRCGNCSPSARGRCR